MIKFENAEVMGWEPAIRGMRNPMNSWDKSDSFWCLERHNMTQKEIDNECGNCPKGENCDITDTEPHYIIGKNDLSLMVRLRNAGTDHRKFMRMITVYVDITAPLYWWKEFDTYKVGTVANSCSTMHKIHSKEIELSDFSFEDFKIGEYEIISNMSDFFEVVIDGCEFLRKKYLETKDRKYWRALIQLLPESYNQKRTVTLNYEVLTNMYHARKAHKLDEWRELCRWIENLPYSQLITGEAVEKCQE